jgi:hypothetical protein
MTAKTQANSETTSLLAYQQRARRNKSFLCGTFICLAVTVSIVAIGVVFHSKLRQLPGKPVNSLRNTLNAKRSKAPGGCEATVLLMRHCEKEGPLIEDSMDDEHCSYLGFERSHFVTTLFGSRWPVPSLIYALSPGRDRHLNYREIETLEPLAKKFGLDINSNYTFKQTEDLAEDIFVKLRSGSMCGRLAVISWKHSYMVDIANALGWDDSPEEYPIDSFDEVWQFKYVHRPPVLYSIEQQDRRHLKKQTSPDWVLYASITQQGFDPLSFSFRSQDYPEGGKKTGTAWLQDLSTPEDL